MKTPFESPYTYLETQLTLRLLAKGWTPDQIVNEIESLRVTQPDDEAAEQLAHDNIRDWLVDNETIR